MNRMSLNRNGIASDAPVRRLVRVQDPLMPADPTAPWKLYTVDGSVSGGVNPGAWT